MKVREIKGTITTADGKTREFSIGTDGGWEQWGAVPADLGNSVDALEAMARGLLEDDVMVSDNDEDEDEDA